MSESPGGVPRGSRQQIIEGRAGIAAPLLAGFSLALVGVIAQDPTHFRWPGATLAALMIPIFCFLGTIRAGYRMMRKHSTVSDLVEAETRLSENNMTNDYDQGKSRVLESLEKDYRSYVRWGYLTFFAFSAGLFWLWVCIAMTVAPPSSGVRETVFRWVAFAIAIAAGINELAIIMAAIRHDRKNASVNVPPAQGGRSLYWP
jgi:hypothetical protein